MCARAVVGSFAHLWLNRHDIVAKNQNRSLSAFRLLFFSRIFGEETIIGCAFAFALAFSGCFRTMAKVFAFYVALA